MLGDIYFTWVSSTDSMIFFVVVPDKLLARLMAVYEVTIGGGTVWLSPLPPSRFAVSIYTVAALAHCTAAAQHLLP